MMTFAIDFSEGPPIYPFDDLKTAAKEGFLEMEGGREYFISSLYEWGVDDYRTQWRGAIVQLVEGKERVGLITSYVGPDNSSYLDWWVLYRVKDTVIIQNQVLFYEKLSAAFSLNNLESYIAPRSACMSPKDIVSEWTVSIFDVQKFLRGLI